MNSSMRSFCKHRFHQRKYIIQPIFKTDTLLCAGILFQQQVKHNPVPAPDNGNPNRIAAKIIYKKAVKIHMVLYLSAAHLNNNIIHFKACGSARAFRL